MPTKRPAKLPLKKIPNTTQMRAIARTYSHIPIILNTSTGRQSGVITDSCPLFYAPYQYGRGHNMGSSYRETLVTIQYDYNITASVFQRAVAPLAAIKISPEIF